MYIKVFAKLNFNDVDKDKIDTKCIKEYIDIKENNPEYIILYQIGSFYEAYFDDAIKFSEVAGITLTSKKFKTIGSVPSAGVKTSSIDIYIRKLLDNDLKVCLCNEYKDENDNYKREVVRRYTNGTVFEKEFLDSIENNFIASINLNHKGGCDFAYCDVSTAQFFKTSAKIEDIKNELTKIQPRELLLPKSQKKIFKNFSEHNITFLDDEYYDNSIESSIKKYCKYNHYYFYVKLENVVEYKITNFMSIDNVTRKSLELTRTRKDLKKKGSLFWFLNYTKTPMGTRTLKRYINEPLLDKIKILKRQEAIEELISETNIIKCIESNLENFTDLSRLCSKISNATIMPKDMLHVADSIMRLNNLFDLCSKLKSEVFKLDKNQYDLIYNLGCEIKKALHEDCSNSLSDFTLIKSGFSANLDYLRSSLDNYYNKLSNFEFNLKKKLNSDKIFINDLKSNGFVIEVPKNTIKIPSDFTLFQSLANVSRYKSSELKLLENEINNLNYKIYVLQKELYSKLKTEVKKFTEIIRNVSYSIAEIDVIYSFAKCAIENNLTKPKITTKDISIKNGYHPSLLKLNNETVKNDTNLSDGKVMILTGANMSGKSTYLKHNAIISILTQIGSFVPAEHASICLIDKLFVRQGSTDDIINNNSSFMVEMNDLKFILDNTSKNSLIILDEPAKSTNTKEGGAIVKAFVEYILNKFHTKTMIATHNIDITELENKYPKNIFNCYLGSIDGSFNDRKLRKGIKNTSDAIITAKLANLPKEIIDTAFKYVNS